MFSNVNKLSRLSSSSFDHDLSDTSVLNLNFCIESLDHRITAICAKGLLHMIKSLEFLFTHS